MTASPSLDGRTFRDVTATPARDVSGATTFRYHELPDGTVYAEYGGGAVRCGFLVGTRQGDELDFRYVQMTTAGSTASGHCHSRLEVLPDGRLRLHECWTWESRVGEGASVLEEFYIDNGNLDNKYLDFAGAERLPPETASRTKEQS